MTQKKEIPERNLKLRNLKNTDEVSMLGKKRFSQINTGSNRYLAMTEI